MKLITLALLCASLLPASAVEITPSDGSDCFNSTLDIAVSEFFGIFDPSVDVSVERIYTICPNTTIGVGEPVAPNTALYQNGDFALFVFNPNVHVRCGASGSSSNNCVLTGGADMLQTLRDRETLASVFPFLPTLVPGLSAYPTDLPSGWVPNVSNMTIRGLTFEDGNGPDDGFFHSVITLAGPGSDLLISDCIVRNSDESSPPSSAILSIYNKEFYTGNGLYMDVTITDCVFEVSEMMCLNLLNCL
jgi:hypothetical protein